MAGITKNTTPAQARTSQLRLLILCPSSESQSLPSPFPAFLHSLTGTNPTSDLSTFAGYTAHPPLHLKTRYYDTNITLWCDELPLVSTANQELYRASITKTEIGTLDVSSTLQTTSTEKSQPRPKTAQEPTLADWKEQMLGSTAREVRDVIGGVIILLQCAQSGISSSDQITKWSKYIETVSTLRDAIEDESGRDVSSIVVLQDITPQSAASADPANQKASKATTSLLEKVEEECLNNQGIMGWDYIAWKSGTDSSNTTSDTDKQTRNEFGEKTGFPRIIEVLEGTDWTASPSSLDPANEDNNEDLEDMIGSSPPDIRNTRNNPNFQLNLTTAPTTTDARLLDEQNEFQREMLGLKMAMLDVADPNSAPSSLAGEYDIGDFGMRTPLRQPRQPREVRGSRLAGSPSNPQAEDDDGQDTGNESFEGGTDEAGDGSALGVEQLSRMMDRAVAVRGTAEGMEPREREKFARREVNKIMKELG